MADQLFRVKSEIKIDQYTQHYDSELKQYRDKLTKVRPSKYTTMQDKDC